MLVQIYTHQCSQSRQRSGSNSDKKFPFSVLISYFFFKCKFSYVKCSYASIQDFTHSINSRKKNIDWIDRLLQILMWTGVNYRIFRSNNSFRVFFPLNVRCVYDVLPCFAFYFNRYTNNPVYITHLFFHFNQFDFVDFSALLNFR